MQGRIFVATCAFLVGLSGTNIQMARDQSGGPCTGAGIVLCHFLPIAPDMDGDIDLTTQFNTGDPAALPDGEIPRADICAAGCA